LEHTARYGVTPISTTYIVSQRRISLWLKIPKQELIPAGGQLRSGDLQVATSGSLKAAATSTIVPMDIGEIPKQQGREIFSIIS